MKFAGLCSLRDQVQKWLAPEVAVPIRVIKHGRLRHARAPYVLVEVLSPMHTRSMYFFRHADGCWYVYPPAAPEKLTPHHAGRRLVAHASET